MKILIIEGIATSGKSTIIGMLQKQLSNQNVVVATEEETHVPIMEKRDELHIEFFVDLLNKLIENQPDVLICDRLYLTQAFRAKCSVSDYSEIEELLSKYSPLTIFLKVGEDTIEDRISKAAEHRGSDYFKFRGTSKERAQYYMEQQRNQINLLTKSKLPYKIYDTTAHNYEAVVQDIISIL